MAEPTKKHLVKHTDDWVNVYCHIFYYHLVQTSRSWTECYFQLLNCLPYRDLSRLNIFKLSFALAQAREGPVEVLC